MITANTIKIKKTFIIELLICYQDSVMGFALKYNTNGRFITKSKDYSFEIALLCFMLLFCFHFLLYAFTMQDMLSLFIFLFFSCIMLLLQNNYFLSHLSQSAFASLFFHIAVKRKSAYINHCFRHLKIRCFISIFKIIFWDRKEEVILNPINIIKFT